MAASVTGLTDTVDSKHQQGIYREDKILGKFEPRKLYSYYFTVAGILFLRKKMNASYFVRKLPLRFWTITWISCLMTMGYSSIYVSLILYVKHDFGFTNQNAITLLGQFFSYNFTINLLTSYVAEKWVSCRHLLEIAISSMTVGFLILSVNSL